MLLNFILPVKSQQIYCEYSISLNSCSYHLKVLYSDMSLQAARKSLFSSLSNSLRKMTSQPCAKDKITAMSTEIIHGPYLSLKRDPPWPFSWVTATVSPDAWCWPPRSILKVSKRRKKMGKVMQRRLKVSEGQFCRSSCRHLHKVTTVGRNLGSAKQRDQMLSITSRDWQKEENGR